MTISEIKRRSYNTSPYFFERKTMKCFGQTLRNFSVIKQIDGRYYISAPRIDKRTGRYMGMTERYFNPVNNELEMK